MILTRIKNDVISISVLALTLDKLILSMLVI
ncbi:hypothetical protein HmCmsJML234_01865 [Escherichia coli]|jgi:hypothetical protein|nr:hypothetical protein A17U_01963 [Escherichia coli KTE228]ELJ41983.1 hypothetical protein WKU_03003 [Escherichia coli KTE177]EQZ11580.1 hypothetical protein G972_03081 [Escherichia coli UMEA 3355-1]GDD16512.1 hypothetical protein HmCmsJML234_01865 [Escherichia coli]